MEELFGVPTQQLMWILLAVFGAAALILGLSALRNRVSFRMAARNLPRRRTQTILVVLGLMLATMLFSASFTTGDTLTNSLRVESLKNLGQVDVQVQAKGSGASGQQQFGPTTSERAELLRREGRGRRARPALRQGPRLGRRPCGHRDRPCDGQGQRPQRAQHGRARPGRKLHEGFDSLTTASGKTLNPSDLGKNEVYLSADAAKGLDVDKGDEIEATFARKVDPTAAPTRTPRNASEAPPKRLRRWSAPEPCPFRSLRS